MTLVREYQPTFVLGDGETKEFSYLFEEVSENFIKVIVKHSDDSTYTPVFSVDLDSHKVVFGESETAPLDTDLVCIYRETPDLQDTPFRTLQGYDARALENILSKIVAMIQELKANGFSTQILQGTPWQLDLLHPDDDGASVVIDYNARILKKGLYFQIVSGNLQVSADGNSFITMPKSADITEFRRLETVLEDLTVQYRLQYKVDGVWYNAESNAEATADEALQIAQDAKDIAQDAKDIVDAFDDRLTQAEQDASDAKQDASDAKDIAQDASDAVSAHIADTNNPHSVTAAQAGALPDTTKYGASLSLTVDSTTYVVTAQLKDQDGNNLGTAQTIDLPLESVVVSGAYDSTTKEVVLTLQGGSTIRFSVADLVSGLQTEITALNMLSADLVDDTNTTHKFVTTTEKSTWNGKQDAISDLATIRSNAQAGKAASDTIATYGDIVTHDVAEFATAAQGAKADTALQSGDNVSELVNDAGYLVMGDLTNFVTKNTAQTISGLKTFSADITLSGTTSIKNTTSGVSYTMLYRDASGIHIGASTQALLLAGSNARPKFNNNDVAMLSDIPTAVSQLTNDSGFITNAVNNLQNYTLTSALATVATSGSYNDLSDKPTIPTVNNATLTIQKNGTTVQTFTANQSTNATANISVPTKTSDITNDSGFITSSALAPYALSADLATVATSGSYNDLSNKPTIPAAQVNSDWNANSGVAQILNKPTLATVATSGSYNDLSNKPTIPTVNNPTITITQGGITKGSFSLNQASGDTIALDAGGGVGNIDNITITANADDEIQAVGTVNQNTAVGATNPIKSWLGDINEYNNQSIPTSNPDALCFIVDKTQTAIDRYIVEAQYPDETNGYTWYFLYSDGWVEQGGVITGNYTGTITLPVEMANTNYYISTTVITTRSGASYDRELYPNSVDTTGFTTQNFSGGQNVPGRWMVQGLSA